MLTASRILPTAARRGRTALVAPLVLPFLLAPGMAKAIEPAEVASIGGLVLQIIGGIATWIDDQSDDTAAAVVAAAWGTDCNLKKRECKDTGFFWAECNETAENACGKGEGHGYSYEGPLGLGKEITVSAKSTVFALHGVPNEKHSAKGYAEASIDGNSRAETDESKQGGLREDWPMGTVLAVATLDTVRLSAPAGAGASATFHGSVQVDGQEVWSTTATLSGDGTFSTMGAVPAAAYTVGFTAADQRWHAILTGYVFEFPVDTLGVALEDVISRDVQLHMDMDGQCQASLEGDDYPPPPILVEPDDLRLNDACGAPLLEGRLVSVSDPAGLFLCAAPPAYGPLLDTDVFGVATQAAFGILDPWKPAPDLPAGTRVQVRGLVTHHDGRTVLTDTQLFPVGAGNAPQPAPMTIAQALQQAEALEGRPVLFQGVRTVGGDPWPLPGEDAVLLVSDPSGAQLPVVIGGWTGVGGTQQPYEPFTVAGIWSQQDPDGLLPCLFDGYMLRVRGTEDIVSGFPTDAGMPLDAPARLRVEPMRPNPLNGGTGALRFSLPRPEAWVDVSIHDPSGRRVRTLFEGSLPAGIHEVRFDGQDGAGHLLPSGVYFTRVRTRTEGSNQKLLLLQ